MKLELKHLAPYLPYNLTVKCMGEFIEDSNEDEPTPKIFDLIGLLKNKCSVSYHGNKELFHHEDTFPILRPLGDLRKPKFINDLEELSEYDMDCIDANRSFESKTLVDNIPYDRVQYLLSKHYDIFDLIEKGLAVDINEL